jgi:hypothetical protein
MIKFGDKVGMRQSFKDSLIKNGSEEHIKEFGDCVGIVEDYVNYNNNGENDQNKIGPELNVRWLPSKLRYGYLPEDLILIKSSNESEENLNISDVSESKDFITEMYVIRDKDADSGVSSVITGELVIKTKSGRTYKGNLKDMLSF